jgi:PIN domain nuclease of toxin-antitoxin system
MSRGDLTQVIAPDTRLLLDTSVLIAYLNGNEPASSAAGTIIDDWLSSGRNDALVAMVTAMEILVRPLRAGLTPGLHTVTFLTETRGLHLVPIDLPIAQQAAALRGFFNVGPADALIIATGLVHQVTYLMTNDRHWQRIPRMPIPVIYLGEHP